MRNDALTAWKQFGGPDNLDPKLRWNAPCWVRLSRTSPLCRLAYKYVFEVKDKKGELAAGYEADIDAETGEIWRIGCVTGGGAAFAPRPVPFSARIALVNGLLKNEGFAPVARAVASGSVLPIVKLEAKGRKFQCLVGDVMIPFTLASSGQVLGWKQGAEGWTGVRLSSAEAARLKGWLRLQNAQTSSRHHSVRSPAPRGASPFSPAGSVGRDIYG